MQRRDLLLRLWYAFASMVLAACGMAPKEKGRSSVGDGGVSDWVPWQEPARELPATNSQQPAVDAGPAQRDAGSPAVTDGGRADAGVTDAGGQDAGRSGALDSGPVQHDGGSAVADAGRVQSDAGADVGNDAGHPELDAGAVSRTIAVRVVGPDGMVLVDGRLMPQTGLTALRALEKIGLPHYVTPDGYVAQIDMFPARGLRGWHYRVGGCHPDVSAGSFTLDGANELVWEHVRQDGGCAA